MTADQIARKKQLGQFFTGVPVARLLVALAGCKGARTIVDPMGGNGDMLQACLELCPGSDLIMGVDVDPVAVANARARFSHRPNVRFCCGDAFRFEFPSQQFDLVVTNPPYIRYQSPKKGAEIAMPGPDDIRRSLVRAIETRPGLSKDARNLFVQTAEAYPGTADVAVPAWILAASLVAENGSLALVVPQAWLSRNYAEPVRDMLDRAFDVQFLVEDGDASWFADAQIRTHLLLAHRRPVDGGQSGRSNVIVARATKYLVNKAGRLTGEFEDEQRLGEALARVDDSGPHTVTAGLTAHVEKRSSLPTGTVLAPRLANRVRVTSTRTLATYAWCAGQGMRTGGNEFFYVARSTTGLATAPRWKKRHVTAPAETQLPTVRRQSDLTNGLHVNPNELGTVLLNLRGWATKRDRLSAIEEGFSPEWWDSTHRLLPDDLAEWISEVSVTPLTDQHPDKTFPALTAVAPNAKRGRDREPVSYWYQIPPLAPRHRPALLVPRVCAARPHAYSNAESAVVDANFATLWPLDDDAMPAEAMFALLNSTWVWANLELNCNVLGGGALKVEAADLRRLALPDLDATQIEELTRLGKRLQYSSDSEVVGETDWIIACALGCQDPDDFNDLLDGLAGGAARNRARGANMAD